MARADAPPEPAIPPEKRPFGIDDTMVGRGKRAEVELPVARLPTDTWLMLPVVVVHGKTPGPTLWLSGAVHGDEHNGIEIIRRVHRNLDAAKLTGTVLALPVVNGFGLISESRYLPDRRDLNRSFPGSVRGSLAARLANLVMTKIVARCEVGIDLHTGSDNRENLPQLRADLSDPDTRKLAEAFGAPVLLDARARDGSLRDAATRKGKKVVLYEGGQAKRFDEHAIAVGVAGIRRVLAALGMYRDAPQPGARSIELSGARWVRARRSGILRVVADLGDEVQHAQAIGEISDAFGGATVAVRAPAAGIVIGLTRLPLVHQGDAIAHIGLP